MKIIADENIPAVEACFSDVGTIQCLPGREISAADIRDAEVLLVRSVTPVNEALLAGSAVKFVGSATIGTDHVDTVWLAQQGIAFANAPGCNAAAVGDYVIAALCAVRPGWQSQTIGIVGCGNVGGGLYRRLKALRVDCRCYDPFLTRDQIPDLCTFDEILTADILCLHTPLTTIGPYPTFHLFDRNVLSRLKPDALVLNAGRGEVVDNRALLSLINGGALQAVLDVWEGEPGIGLSLLEAVTLGTPHIAGYSVEGKLRGTEMIHEAFCRWYATIKDNKAASTGCFDTLEAEVLRVSPPVSFEDIVLAVYNPVHDWQRTCQTLFEAFKTGGLAAIGPAFDLLRKTYPQRHEFSHYQPVGEIAPALRRQLAAAGFQV